MTREEAKEFIVQSVKSDVDIAKVADAIKALEQKDITWIVGNDNVQIAVRNMPVDMMQKICAIIGNEQEVSTKNDLAVDCISRKAALDITWQDPSYSDPLNVLTEVRDKIRELPSVTPQEPRWIPVSERLPEIQNYSDNYLVTLKSGGVHIGMFIECNGKHWWTHYDDVVAWMPLPKPYEPQESEE